MGSSVTGIPAILFMDELEKNALLSSCHINHYSRYVDDVYQQTKDEDCANKFHQDINKLHPKIKFELEKPKQTEDGYSLSLLDFTVNVKTNGQCSFDFYKKQPKKPLFIHYRSDLPMHTKINIIKNERNRINLKCTSPTKRNSHQEEFDNILRLNGYPEHSINKTYNLFPITPEHSNR